MSLLRVEGVTKKFNGIVANDNVSFNVDKGQIVGLIGPNGAGKTTMFNCIAGYFPTTAGSILFDGVNISGFTPERCARVGIGRTFQIARTFGSMTAQENVMVGAFIGNPSVEGAR